MPVTGLRKKCTLKNIASLFWAKKWDNQYPEYNNPQHRINASFAYWIIENKLDGNIDPDDMDEHLKGFRNETLWDKGQFELYMQAIVEEFEQHEETKVLIEHFGLSYYINRSRSLSTRRTRNITSMS